MYFFLQTIAVTFPFSANDCNVCCRGILFLLQGCSCFVGVVLFCCGYPVLLQGYSCCVAILDCYAKLQFFFELFITFPHSPRFYVLCQANFNWFLYFFCKIWKCRTIKNTLSKIAYLCNFRLFFCSVLKGPNLRFESAHLTSSKRLFDELIKALWQPQRGPLTKQPLF